MDTNEKLALLGSAARFEVAGQRQSVTVRPGPSGALCVGDTVGDASGSLLRVLQSSYCEQDCAYCPLRRSNDPNRAAFSPDELAGAFANQWQRGRVSGLMLSSATDGGPDGSMERMLDTVRILRTRHEFDGYVHLKVLPGAGASLIEEAARLADRLSLNIEVPGPEYLDGLQTGKRWQEDILRPLQRLRELDLAGEIRSGITGQLLVGVTSPGGVSASDRALAGGSRWLRREFDVRRVHYGSFTPAAGTPLAEAAAPDPRRRARLYQWDWLATHYQYADNELDAAFDHAGRLPLALDPKLAVTIALPEDRPVEVNSATYEDLLRVPGIGPVSARRIVDLRHLGALRDLQDLKVLGVVASRAAPFVLLNGKKPPEAPASLQRIKRALRAMEPQPVQLSLWPELL
ncbi:MAG: Radical domain protein [Chloroflexi bacterium]|nr:Radical domain protein [Chloroflexota bacterium]